MYNIHIQPPEKICFKVFVLGPYGPARGAGVKWCELNIHVDMMQV